MKTLDNKEEPEVSISDLTWQLEPTKNENHYRQMGQFPEYTPPKKMKRRELVQANRSNGNRGDSPEKKTRQSEADFEVVTVDHNVSRGATSRFLSHSVYDSDSSDDGFSQEQKTKLPTTQPTQNHISPSRKMPGSGSDSESDTPLESFKHSKEIRSRDFVSVPQSSEGKGGPEGSDSRSESDTPMASLAKIAKLSDTISRPTKGLSSKSVNNETIDSKVKRTKVAKKNTKVAEKMTSPTKDDKKRRKSNIPEFRGTSMLEPDPASDKATKTSNQPSFEGVKYGADILAELFASDDDSSDDEHVKKKMKKKKGKLKPVQKLSVPEFQGIGALQMENSECGGKVNSTLSVLNDNYSSETVLQNVETALKEFKQKSHGSDVDVIRTSSDSNSESGADSESVTDSESDSPIQSIQRSKAESVRNKKRKLSIDKIQQSESSDSDSSNADEGEIVIGQSKPMGKEPNLNMQTDPSKLKPVPVLPVDLQRKRAALVTDEFDSGITFNPQSERGEGTSRISSTDSDDDLLDLIASGKMSKVKQFEKKAIADMTNKGKKATKLDNVNRLGKPSESIGNSSESKSSPNKSTNVKVAEKVPEPTKSSASLKEKHAADNKKRLDTLKQRESEARKQKAAIKNALSSVVSISVIVMKYRISL